MNIGLMIGGIALFLLIYMLEECLDDFYPYSDEELP